MCQCKLSVPVLGNSPAFRPGCVATRGAGGGSKVLCITNPSTSLRLVRLAPAALPPSEPSVPLDRSVNVVSEKTTCLKGNDLVHPGPLPVTEHTAPERLISNGKDYTCLWLKVITEGRGQARFSHLTQFLQANSETLGTLRCISFPIHYLYSAQAITQ